MKLVRIVLLSFAVIFNASAVQALTSLPYLDLPANHSCIEAISYAYEQQFATGQSETLFAPDDHVNRAEAAEIITLAAGLVYEEELSLSYSDVPSDSWYASSVSALTKTGAVSGYPDQTFGPEKTVSVSEAVKMILIAEGISVESPTENMHWYEPYLNKAYQMGWINSYEATHPEYELSRSELVDIVWRIQSGLFQETTFVEFGKATYYADEFEGDHTASGEVFSQSHLTAAHPSLPFGTIVRVTNLNNNLSVDVRINDRGPYAYGMIVDLSSSAFSQIAPLSSGVVPVKIEILPPSAYYSEE